MTTNQFRPSISDGTRVLLSLPGGHRASDLDGKFAVVLRCLGCAEEERTPETVDYMVKVDGSDGIIIVRAAWIAS